MELKNVDIAMLSLLIPAFLAVYFGVIRPALNDKNNKDDTDKK